MKNIIIGGDFKIAYGIPKYVPRSMSCIDWIQEGNIEIGKVQEMRPYYRTKIGEQYAGVILGFGTTVFFSNKNIKY